MEKNILYAIGCATGGACIGFFANQLNSALGAFVFTVGVALLTFCIYRLSNDEER